MNLLLKLLRREAQLVEQLEQVRYELRVAGWGDEKRGEQLRASRVRMKQMIRCRHCGNDTRAGHPICDWCEKPWARTTSGTRA